MRFKSRFFSFLLIASFLLSHSFGEITHQFYHSVRNRIHTALAADPTQSSKNESHDPDCPIEKLVKSLASESVHFASLVSFRHLSNEHQREAQLFTKIYSVPAYEYEYSRGPPQV